MQPLVAIRAITRLVKNPDHTHEVFTIIRALSGSDLEKGLKRFQATEVGKTVLQDRRQLTSVLNDRNMLATLPPSSFGRAYLEFITDEGLSADGLIEASEGEDGIELAGGQVPMRPGSPVDSEGDHRLAMTAMALASKCGGIVSGSEACTVSDPGFIERLMAIGGSNV